MDNATQVTTAEKAQSLDPVDEYEDAEKNFKPTSIRFLSIMIAMYLSFFLVGLVSTYLLAINLYRPRKVYKLTRESIDRTDSSSQQPFLGSRTSSIPYRILAGMEVLIC